MNMSRSRFGCGNSRKQQTHHLSAQTQPQAAATPPPPSTPPNIRCAAHFSNLAPLMEAKLAKQTFKRPTRRPDVCKSCKYGRVIGFDHTHAGDYAQMEAGGAFIDAVKKKKRRLSCENGVVARGYHRDHASTLASRAEDARRGAIWAVEQTLLLRLGLQLLRAGKRVGTSGPARRVHAATSRFDLAHRQQLTASVSSLYLD